MTWLVAGTSVWTEANGALRVTAALWRLLMAGARQADAEVVLVDVGPHLGAISRSALIAADHIVIPVAPDFLSVQGLQNLGPALRKWSQLWQERLLRNPDAAHDLPAGRMQPLGYALLSYGVRLGQAARDYQRWLTAIPAAYRSAVLEVDDPPPAIENDPYCLAEVKQYRLLMPLSYEAHKPMFALKPADGAFGGHQAAVAAAGATYSALAARILTELASMPTALGDEREKLRKNQ